MFDSELAPYVDAKDDRGPWTDCRVVCTGMLLGEGVKRRCSVSVVIEDSG